MTAADDSHREDAPAVRIGNPWQTLRHLTPARIALGRCGISQPTAPQLAFQLAHAQARDAVHCALEVASLRSEIEALGLSTIALHSAAATRGIYLQRPDLGRRLDQHAADQLSAAAAAAQTAELAIVVADGLSALAVQRHAPSLLGELLALLRSAAAADAPPPWSIAPVVVVEQGRVAVGDEIGERLGSRIVVVLIGERPGLSSPDSLGIYLTWAPRRGRSDAERNCISNVRPAGLSCRNAAARLAYLLGQARQRQLSGVELKDDSESAAAPAAVAAPAMTTFLLSAQRGD